MALPWTPRVDYDVGPTTLLFSHPQKLWTPRSPSIGGQRISATGIPASYVVRRDYQLYVTVRFPEAELAAVQAWIEHAQGAESFTWYPDQAVAGAHYEVYLDHPCAGEDFAPVRDERFPAEYTLDLVLRRADGLPWTDRFYS